MSTENDNTAKHVSVNTILKLISSYNEIKWDIRTIDDILKDISSNQIIHNTNLCISIKSSPGEYRSSEPISSQSNSQIDFSMNFHNLSMLEINKIIQTIHAIAAMRLISASNKITDLLAPGSELQD
jgi:hypothetical protein